MQAVVALIAVGSLLIFLDFFIPTFGFMSVTGLGLVTWGLVLAFHAGALTGWLSLASTLVLLGVEVWLGWRLAKRSSFIHTTDIQADVTPQAMRDTLVGVQGVTRTPLCPSGKVDVDGRQYDARCALGMLDRGTAVRVVEVRGRELLVRPVGRMRPA